MIGLLRDTVPGRLHIVRVAALQMLAVAANFAAMAEHWTADLVLAGLRACLTREPRLGEDPALFRFILDRARDVLGTLDFTALVLRCGPTPGLSIREMCRQRYGWRGSRSEFYRRSRLGAIAVAAALNREGIRIPWRLGGDFSRTEARPPSTNH
jgi:hypothetical protein